MTGSYILNVVDLGNDPHIMLVPSLDENYDGTQIKCNTSIEQAMKYYEGEEIRVFGTVEGLSPDTSGIIIFNDCYGMLLSEIG